MSAPSSSDIGIGYEPGGGGGSRHFDGLLDDARFYRRALTEAEIPAIYTENEYVGNVDGELRP